MTQPLPSETISYERYVDGLRAHNSRLRHALTVLCSAVKQDVALFADQPHKDSALGIAEAALAEGTKGSGQATITIHLEGGLVQDVTGIPPGVEVRVEDHDEGDTSHPSWDAEKGCFVTVYGGEDV